MLPPILEIYVVWHPGDAAGRQITNILLAHFRGTTFSGLIGGAIDVYVRSTPASGSPADAPSLIPVLAPPPYGLSVPRYTAVVVVAGTELASAVEAGGPWLQYLEPIATARRNHPDSIGLYPVQIAPLAFDNTILGGLVGGIQQVAAGRWGKDSFDETLCRCWRRR